MVSPILYSVPCKKASSTTHSFWFSGNLPLVTCKSLIELARLSNFTTNCLSPAVTIASVWYVPCASSIRSSFSSSVMSSSVSPSVDITWISITFLSSKYVSKVNFISGLVAFIPAKNPTPKSTIRSIDINLLNPFIISLKQSFNKAFFMELTPLLLAFLFWKFFYYIFT